MAYGGDCTCDPNSCSCSECAIHKGGGRWNEEKKQGDKLKLTQKGIAQAVQCNGARNAVVIPRLAVVRIALSIKSQTARGKVYYIIITLNNYDLKHSAIFYIFSLY